MNKRMIDINRITIVLLLLSLAFTACSGGGANPVANTDVTVTGPTVVSEDSPLNGTTFTLVINLDNEVDLVQASLELSYDHSVIEMISVASGGTLVDSALNSFDSGVGGTNNLLITYRNFPIINGGTGPYSGSGVLCTITFNALSVDSTIISLDNSDTKYYYDDGRDRQPLLPSQSITVQ